MVNKFAEEIGKLWRGPRPDHEMQILDCKPKVTVVIPARLNSQRLPRKVLLSDTGKPMIQHVYENALSATWVDSVIIAAPGCDGELIDAATDFGAVVIGTASAIKGSDRIAMVLGSPYCKDSDIIINLQCDEPEITGRMIDELIYL